jgi:hypothetical protein
MIASDREDCQSAARPGAGSFSRVQLHVTIYILCNTRQHCFAMVECGGPWPSMFCILIVFVFWTELGLRS